MSYHLRCENCEAPFEAKRPHARFCSDVCRVAHWEAEQENGREVPAQRVVVHTHDLRKLGISGNPSQRATDAEEKFGVQIQRTRESRNGRPGSRFTLVGSSADLLPPSSQVSAGSGETSRSPEADSGGASPSIEPSESATLFDFGEGRGNYTDPDQRAA